MKREYTPLVDKTATNKRESRCKRITVSVFVLILIGFGVAYFSPLNPVVNSGISAKSAIESHGHEVSHASPKKHKGMELKYQTGSGEYKGAVLEYNSVYHKSYYWKRSGRFDHEDLISSADEAKEWQNQNILRIKPYVEQAALEDVDILVLSEFALNGLVPTRDEMFLYLEVVPDPESAECIDDSELCTPCDNDDFAERTTLQQLSCLAQDNNINLVVNYGDYELCTIGVDECEDGRFQWNTQIVFDFNGVIISKYYKIHTYKEDEYDVPAEEDPTSFTITLPSDPNTQVTFGILICYDSMYATPLIPLVKQGVTDFVMSHWWVNSGPIMNIDMWTQAVSKTYGINLLFAANTWVNEGRDQNVLTGAYYLRGFGARDSSGSGLYSQGNVVNDWYNQDDSDEIGVLVTGKMPIGITSNAAALPDFDADTDYLIGNIADVEGAGNFFTDAKVIGEVKRGRNEQKVFTDSIELDSGFKCTVSATVSKFVQATGSDTRRNWIWMSAYDGYFQIPDGGNIWYYQNICVIGVCDENCYRWGIQGDTTHVEFSEMEVTANYDDEATIFVLNAGDDATPVDDVLFFEKGEKDVNTGTTTVKKAKGTEDKVLLGLSVYARVYSKDTKVIAD